MPGNSGGVVMTRMRAVVYTVRQLGEIMGVDESGTLSAVHGEAAEWADIIALAVQRLMEMGLEPRQMLLDRILSRYENREQMQKIIDTYAKWYDKEFGKDASEWPSPDPSMSMVLCKCGKHGEGSGINSILEQLGLVLGQVRGLNPADSQKVERIVGKIHTALVPSLVAGMDD